MCDPVLPSIPECVRRQVLEVLPGPDVARCGALARDWAAAHDDRQLWQALCEHAGLPESCDVAPSPKEAYAVYAEAMTGWRCGSASARRISGDQLLERGIGDEDIEMEDATTMICSLVLDGRWLVVAFNGGVVQFWRLPEATCVYAGSLGVGIVDMDFDLKTRQICAGLSDLSVVLFSCAGALGATPSAVPSAAPSPVPAEPVLRLGSFEGVQSLRSVAFWDQGILVATSRRVLVLSRAAEQLYCAQNCSFFGMTKAHLVVQQRAAQVEVCRWEGDELRVDTYHLQPDYDLIQVVEGSSLQVLCEHEGHVCLVRLDSWATQLQRLPKTGDIAIPVALPDGSVQVIQVVPGPALLFDGVLHRVGPLIINDAELVAAEACAQDVNNPQVAYLTFAEAPTSEGMAELRLLQLPAGQRATDEDGTLPRTVLGESMLLGTLDLGDDELGESYLDTGRVMVASSWEFLVANDRTGLQIFQFCAPYPPHEH